MLSLNERIKEARKYANLTQAELSGLIGASLRALINYEKDASKVTVTLVQKIAQECHVNEAWLLTGLGDKLKGLSGADNSESKKIPLDEAIDEEHSEIIKRFKSKEEARDINIKLVALDHHSRSAFKKAVNYIDALWDGVEAVKTDLQEEGAGNMEKQSGRTGGKKAVNGH